MKTFLEKFSFAVYDCALVLVVFLFLVVLVACDKKPAGTPVIAPDTRVSLLDYETAVNCSGTPQVCRAATRTFVLKNSSSASIYNVKLFADCLDDTGAVIDNARDTNDNLLYALALELPANSTRTIYNPLPWMECKNVNGIIVTGFAFRLEY